eukprot:10416159-Lingulodinium_polyedra.AAC.1
MSTVNVVLRMPPNTLTLSAATTTDRAGLVHVRSACASAISAIVRAAKRTFTWKPQLELLVQAASEFMPGGLARCRGKMPWPKFWSGPCFAAELEAA